MFIRNNKIMKITELIEKNNKTGLIEFFSTVKQARDKSTSEKED